MGWIQERGSKQQTHKVTIEPRFFFQYEGVYLQLKLDVAFGVVLHGWRKEQFYCTVFNCSYMIGVEISRFKIDPMLSTKGSKAPGSFMDSRLYEQTVEPPPRAAIQGQRRSLNR